MEREEGMTEEYYNVGDRRSEEKDWNKRSEERRRVEKRTRETIDS